MGCRLTNRHGRAFLAEHVIQEGGRGFGGVGGGGGGM